MTAKKILFAILLLQISFLSSPFVQAQEKSTAQKTAPPETESAVITFRAGNFQLQLVKASQTVAALQPDTLQSLDFTPGENLLRRNGDGSYHLGDINLRIRTGNDPKWRSFSTATHRLPVNSIRVSGNVLAGADLANTLPADIPVIVERYWEVSGKDLVLHFVLKNKTTDTVEIGALGIPVIFNNILKGKTLERAHRENVLYDPYMGMDAGYLQVTRLSGQAPSLLVLPYGKTPFEAYNPLLDDPEPRDVTFEGFYEWMVYSKAFADREWKNTQPWNAPHSLVLLPGERRSVGLRFVLSGKAEDTQAKLIASGRPVAVGIPGYVVPQDVSAKLFLNYSHSIKTISVYPANVLTVVRSGNTKNGWQAYTVKGNLWGRATLTITYADRQVQTISYKVIKPETAVVKDYGKFLNKQQWFDQPDTFHRSPSYMTYDYEAHKPVTQDERVWVAGLSDEAGAGSWLGASMKQVVAPDKMEIARLESFVNATLWGRIQYKSGPHKFGVRKSLFYYSPDTMPRGTYSDSVNYKTWGAWNSKEAASVGRTYNYPHVAAAYWALYRLARYHRGLVHTHPWKWYLTNSYETAMAMVNQAPDYTQFGLMEGSVFCLILKDLKREGLNDMAVKLEATMKKRALHWRTLQYPFGSEMPWDSTGQEEVYIWSAYFGFDDKAATTLSAILAYMPVVPHWAYNGNARRYWDFGTAGKISRIERMIHHYGSGLNAIPVLAAYRQNPRDFYLLQVGYGGLMGSIANINEEGFAPCAFHAFPETMKNDAYSGDYGSGFYGYSVNTATYIIKHPEFGWLAFGGNLEQKGISIVVKPTTAARSAIFIAEAGLWINFTAGTIDKVVYNLASKQVKISLNAGNQFTPSAYFQLEYAKNQDIRTKYVPSKAIHQEHGLYRITLKKGIKNDLILRVQNR